MTFDLDVVNITRLGLPLTLTLMTFDLDLVNATAWGWTVLGLGLAKAVYLIQCR